MKNIMARKLRIGDVTAPTDSVLIGYDHQQYPGAECFDRYCLRSHIYLLLEDMQLKIAIALVYHTSPSIETEEVEDKEEDNDRVVLSSTEGSRIERRHSMQAKAIPNDVYMSTYISIPSRLFRFHTLLNRKHASCRFCSIPPHYSCSHT